MVTPQRPINADALNALWRQSVAAERAGDLKQAEAGYRRILSAAPGHGPALRRLAGIGRRSGDKGAAKMLLERAVTVAPEYWPAKLDLADLMHEAGDVADAAALYRKGLDAADAQDPPRLSNYAAALMKLGRFADALEATERHRATGAESANVSAYRAQALWELNEDAMANDLSDPDRFVQSRMPAAPEGYADMATFNQALVEAVSSHPTLTDRWDPTLRAARGGRITTDIFADGLERPPAIEALHRMIAREVETLAGGLEHVDGHPFLGRRPKQPLKIVSWANIMPGQGVQAPHIHNLGWLSGVYYPKLPSAMGDDGDHAGWLGFGRPGYGVEVVRSPNIRFLKPETGMMACFPSYLWHWTEPFAGQEERVSIAFDVA